MNSIAERVRSTAKAVESLGSRSDQIGAIVGTIEDIADQTNLLALNAAIEAARAGEQGRGFAVVADEVRALAERTTRATREIGEMIKAIQLETKSAVIAMEEGVSEVAKGSEKAADSGRALEQILQQINDVNAQIHQVATAAEEQTATTSEISNNMQQITEVVAQTSRGAHESASSANRLSALADDLRRIVGQFKVE
jgi:methyl-accepting chemotaxis protein